MDFVDYYKTLGISKTATQKDIKGAYRKLARKFHPDLNPKDKDAKKNFQQINEANEVLSNVENRKKYDKYGKEWQHAEQYDKQGRSSEQQGSRQQQEYRQTRSDDDFSSFFEAMFGNSQGGERRNNAKFRGEDFTSELQLNLTEAYKTHKQTLTVNGQQIRITIPAGIENGQTIKISGHGGKGKNGGPDGDLYITFSIAADSGFKRLGDNLYASVNLDLYTAILGGEITINTLNGKVKLTVKPETQNGSKVKLKNKGFPVYKKEGEFGDLLLTYNILIPKNLTDKQKALFSQLADINN